MAGRLLCKLANSVGLARRNHKILRRIVLEHQPHGFYIFFGVAPVAFGVQVAQFYSAFFASFYFAQAHRYLARYKGLALCAPTRG